ncbi:unnamed protein product, partial [Ilex paraguariensis]
LPSVGQTTYILWRSPGHHGIAKTSFMPQGVAYYSKPAHNAQCPVPVPVKRCLLPNQCPVSTSVCLALPTACLPGIACCLPSALLALFGSWVCARMSPTAIVALLWLPRASHIAGGTLALLSTPMKSTS